MSPDGRTLRELAWMVRGTARFWGEVFGTVGDRGEVTEVPYDPNFLKELALRSGWEVKG